MVNVTILDAVKSNLPAFKKIVALMEKKYTPPTVRPNMSIDRIMFDAGQYSVLEHFRMVVAQAEKEMNTDVIGEP